MTDYLAQLERELTAAAARVYGPPSGAARPDGVRRRWARWLRSPLALVVGLLVAGGSAAGAVAALRDRSAPLTGSVPTARGSYPAARTIPGGLRYDVPVTPDLEPGDAGWCSYPEFALAGRIDDTGAGVCAPAPSSGSPVLLGGAEPLSDVSEFAGSVGHALASSQARLGLVWLIVSSRVAGVRLGARSSPVVAPRSDRRLPRGWRAVVTFSTSSAMQFRPVPLDRAGRPLAEPRAPVSRGTGTLEPVVTVRPGARSPGPCAIARVALRPVTAQWEVVAARAPSLGASVPGSTLFSCARAWFLIAGQTQAPSAAVLLDARDPRTSAPRPPGLVSAGAPGVFSDPSAELLARRVGRGWLVVQSRSRALGLRLLGHIRVVAPR